MISSGERKGRTISLAYMVWHSVHLILLHDKVQNMAANTRKLIGLIITNSQNMYIFENSLILHYITPFQHIRVCSSCLLYTVTDEVVKRGNVEELL